MAAAIIPLVTAAIPLLTPLVMSLVTHVEHLFGAKTGATKFDNVLTSTLKVAQDLGTAGKIPGQLDPQSIAVLIQSVVSDMKAKGLLTPEIAPSVSTSPGSSVATLSAPAGASAMTIIGGSLTFGPAK